MFDDDAGVVDPDEWEPVPAEVLEAVGGWDFTDVPGQPQPVPAGFDDDVLRCELEPLGPGTLTRLTAVPAAMLSQEGLCLALRQLTVPSRHLDALKAEVTALIAGPEPAVSAHGRVDDFAAHEVAVATWCSVYAADRQVSLARDLASRLQATAVALRAGEVSLAQAMALSQATSTLDVSVAREVEAKMLRFSHRQDIGLFRAGLRRWLARLDPEYATKARAARKDCEVTHTPYQDGTGGIYLRGPLEVTTAISTALDAYAAATKASLGGTAAQRKLAGLRDWAEAYLASPGCPTSHGRPPTVSITIDLASLLGMTDHPAHIPGVGPIPAEAARWAVADGAPIRRLVTDPLTGHLLDLSPKTYTASPGLAEYLITRNVTSAAPHSATPATRCDIEHNTPHHHHGPTNTINCTPIDRRWHRAKTHTHWTYTKHTNGTITWTSPTGLTCQIDPYDYTLAS